MKTQDECKKEFLDELRRFLKKICEIDSTCPAKPVQEPEWWCEMMGLYRDAYRIEEKHRK